MVESPRGDEDVGEGKHVDEEKEARERFWKMVDDGIEADMASEDEMSTAWERAERRYKNMRWKEISMLARGTKDLVGDKISFLKGSR